MGQSPKILVCEHDASLRTQVARRLEKAGFWVDTAGSAGDALHKLESLRFDAMTLSLVLSDQDSMSFLHDLSVLGLSIPVLVTSIHSGKEDLPPQLMNNMDVDIEIKDAGPEPEWVRKAADQARIIFAIKTACQRSRHYEPRILHIEPDAFSAGLMNAALNKNCSIAHVRQIGELDEALCQGPYDIILLNPSLEDDQSLAAMQQISWAFPGIPIVLHSQYTLNSGDTDIHPIDADTGRAGLGLIEALRQRVLYNMDTPAVYHA